MLAAEQSLTGKPEGVWVHEHPPGEETFELGTGRGFFPQSAIAPPGGYS